MGLDRRILKQMQDMQANMAKAQAELMASEVEGTAGGGMVTVRLTGRQEIEEVKLAPEVVDPGDVEMLQDLVAAAVNDALKKMAQLTEQRMGAVTSGLPNIPGLTS